jgi:hypothetical protein
MIESITHKGLRLYFEKGNGSKLPAEYLAKIALILDALDALASSDQSRLARITGLSFGTIKEMFLMSIMLTTIKKEEILCLKELCPLLIRGRSCGSCSCMNAI